MAFTGASRVSIRLASRLALRRDLGPHLAPGLPRFLDGAFVFDRRDVSRLATERHGLEHAPHDLAAARLGKHVDEVELADDGDRTELLPDRLEELLPQKRRGLSTLLEDD